MSGSDTPELTPDQSQVLTYASRARIADSLSAPCINDEGQWIPESNGYFNGALDVLKSDGKTVPVEKRQDFAQYLGASAFVHAGDAWSYFSRALDAVTRGDVHAAIHLCYYSELRAALSILSSEGIYIGNRLSLAVRSGGDVAFITDSPTHQAAWQCLHSWLATKRAADLLGKIITPASVPLSEWVDAMPSGGLRPVMASLLTRLSFDLQVFAQDRENRNAASYDPTRFNLTDLSIPDAYQLVDSAWQSLEPDRIGGFPQVDLELITEIHLARFRSTANPDEMEASDWEEWLQGSIPTQMIGTETHDRLFGAFAGSERLELLTHMLADGERSSSPPEIIFDMIGRSIMLMRIATGSYAQLLKESTLGPGDVEPWVSSLAIARGIWELGGEPDEKLDLWEDVVLARMIVGDLPAGSGNATALKVLNSNTIALGQAERVVAWSV